MPKIILEYVGSPSFSLQVEGGQTVGRYDPESKTHVQITGVPNLDWVSREHIQIITTVAGWAVIDRNSFNGTYLNGVKLTPGAPYPIKNGDYLILASTTFVVRIHP